MQQTRIFNGHFLYLIIEYYDLIKQRQSGI